jgi:hypothetical protein
MLADLSKVTWALREETLAVKIANRRDELLRQLRETGEIVVREGARKFTIRVPKTESQR